MKGGELTINSKDWEWYGTSLLNVLWAEPCWETKQKEVEKRLVERSGWVDAYVVCALVAGGGTGMSSEQSTSLLVSCPTTDSFIIAVLKFSIMRRWLSTMLCHSQAVRFSNDD